MSIPRAITREDALRVADAHEVARPVRRQERRRPAGRLEHLLAAPRRPRARRARSRRSRARTSSAIERRRSSGSARALRDPEDELPRRPRRVRRCRAAQSSCGGPPPRAPRAERPPAGRCRGTSRCRSRALRWISRDALGREARRRCRRRPSGTSRPRRRPASDRVPEREDLEAARVGEDRAVPAGERVQAAELRDQLVSRAGSGGGRCCRG